MKGVVTTQTLVDKEMKKVKMSEKREDSDLSSGEGNFPVRAGPGQARGDGIWKE